MASARLKQDLGSAWHLSIGVLNQDAARNINTPVNNLTSNSGDYVSSFANGFAPRFVITSDAAYLNGSFSTGRLEHDLTFGTAGYRASSYSVITPASPASVRLGVANIDAPMIFPETWEAPMCWRTSTQLTTSQALTSGTTHPFVPGWATRLAVSQDFRANYNATGKQASEYSDDGLSPSVSIIFNPASLMTTFSPTPALQAGDLAPGTAANAGTSLAPYRSKEYELDTRRRRQGRFPVSHRETVCQHRSE
jgi:iron complex outermembrane receptor protein